MLITLDEVVLFNNDYKPKNILVTRIQASEYVFPRLNPGHQYVLWLVVVIKENDFIQSNQHNMCEVNYCSAASICML